MTGRKERGRQRDFFWWAAPITSELWGRGPWERLAALQTQGELGHHELIEAHALDFRLACQRSVE